MVTSVYEIHQLVDDDRPVIALKRKNDLDQASLTNYGIIRGNPGFQIEAWTPWDDFYCEALADGVVSEWDYFQWPCTSGLFSKRALSVLMAYIEHCFVPVPAMMEGRPYYFLHTQRTIDALNVEVSDITFFETTFIRIKRHKFHMDRLIDPSIFSIPQFRPIIFATDSIPEIIENAGLVGFDLRLVDLSKPAHEGGSSADS